MKTALAPPEESGVSCLDDIPITNTTWEEHLDTIHRVFRKLRTAGLSVNFAKCNFAASAQEFLGMMVDINGIRLAPSKMEAVAKMPRPTNIEELRAFLDLTEYLRQFVANYSIIAAPLTNILRNKEFATKRARKLPFPWTVEQERAFASLKKSLASTTVLAFPDWNQPFTLHTDASPIGAGALLMQNHGSKEVVIAYASHRFSRTDSRRGPTERECMAVLWGVGHYPQFLCRPTIQSDHRLLRPNMVISQSQPQPQALPMGPPPCGVRHSATMASRNQESHARCTVTPSTPYRHRANRH